MYRRKWDIIPTQVLVEWRRENCSLTKNLIYVWNDLSYGLIYPSHLEMDVANYVPSHVEDTQNLIRKLLKLFIKTIIDAEFLCKDF